MTEDPWEHWLQVAHEVFLVRQDRQSGLLPASTALTHHGDYAHAWVRDNVYSILGVWALSRSLRRHGRHDAHATDLEAAVRAVMRGLLKAMMGQSEKVERFKRSEDPLDALHAKYDAHTGAPVVDDDGWGHLQIDATALFLLQLAQMTAAGLVLVETEREADFVQNLVHYIGPAYRTPDYGVWERGDKKNHGIVEINASSVGMAKAALEAMDGLRLAAPDGRPLRSILVTPDEIARARETLSALLPQESISKETDAALLSVIGFPAFAVEDTALSVTTRQRVVDRLEGRYGFKRFLRDGHQTALEDADRLHYQPGEMAAFEHIESEWPLFFAYSAVDAGLRGDLEALERYTDKLNQVAVDRGGVALLPELYLVPQDRVVAEVASPGSQARTPNANVPLYWAQSLAMIASLLREGLLVPDDIDPLRRRAMGGEDRSIAIQIALLAEDADCRDSLRDLGLPITLKTDIGEDLLVLPPHRLAQSLTELGANSALQLTGRPLRRLGALSTSRLYRQGDIHILFTPIAFDKSGGVARFDAEALCDRLRAELMYLARHWRQESPALLVIPASREALFGPGGSRFRALIGEIAHSGALRGGPQRARIRFRHLRDFLDAPAVTLDSVSRIAAEPPMMVATDHYCLLWADDQSSGPSEDELRSAHAMPIEALHDALISEPKLGRLAATVEALVVRGQASAPSQIGPSVADIADRLFESAAQRGAWSVARRLSVLCDRGDDRLQDMVKEIVVRLRRIEAPGGDSVARPMPNAALRARLSLAADGDIRVRALAEETLIHLGGAMRADPKLFQGVRTVRLWDWLTLIAGEVEVDPLSAPPHRLARAIEAVLRDTPSVRKVLRDNQSSVDWARWRSRLGVLTRVGDDFNARIWRLLERCDGLTIGAEETRLDSALARADHTPFERKFSMAIEARLSRISDPIYRTYCLEALNAAALACEAEPTLTLGGDLRLDPLIHDAVATAFRSAGSIPNTDNPDAAPWKWFACLPPQETERQLVQALHRRLNATEGCAAA